MSRRSCVLTSFLCPGDHPVWLHQTLMEALAPPWRRWQRTVEGAPRRTSRAAPQPATPPAALGPGPSPRPLARAGGWGASAAHGLRAGGRDRGRTSRRGPASGGPARPPSRAGGATARAWAAREETGDAWRTARAQGRSILALARCHKRMQDQGGAGQRPTRRAGRVRERRLTPASAPRPGGSHAVGEMYAGKGPQQIRETINRAGQEPPHRRAPPLSSVAVPNASRPRG